MSIISCLFVSAQLTMHSSHHKHVKSKKKQRGGRKEKRQTLVVVSCAKINHDMTVAIKEHDGARVVELVHLVEARHLSDVHKIDDCHLADLVGNPKKTLVHLPAFGVIVVSKTDDHNAAFL